MKPAFLTFNKAVDLLHQGGRLQVMHAGPSKRDWFVIHRDGGRVWPEHAERIKAMPDILPQDDGLLPGCSQTSALKPAHFA